MLRCPGKRPQNTLKHSNHVFQCRVKLRWLSPNALHETMHQLRISLLGTNDQSLYEQRNNDALSNRVVGVDPSGFAV